MHFAEALATCKIAADFGGKPMQRWCRVEKGGWAGGEGEAGRGTPTTAD